MNILATPVALVALLFCNASWALDVSLAGVFGGKAVLVIDGGQPRTLSVGARSPEGVKLLSVEGDSAWVDINGQRARLRIGDNVASSRSSGPSSATVVHLTADGQGHFLSPGSINGAPVTFMVDTGATIIAMDRSTAQRAGLDLSKAPQVPVHTAGGIVRSWRVQLSSVKLGSVTLSNVEGAVVDAQMPRVLLGMSFLNRMDMERSGQTLTLRQRF